jgi:YfiH family protein
MEKHIKDGLTYYTFDIFKSFPELRHGVFTRYGPYNDEFNLSFEHGDEAEVIINLTLAEKLLGLNGASFVNQGHFDRILELNKGEEYSPRKREELKEGYDALIGYPGHNLMVKLADCQGVIIYAPDKKVLALVHSGWRGSVLNILGKVVNKLISSYEVMPLRLYAAISPSIGPCCMEFKSWEKDLPQSLWKYRMGDSSYIDFWQMSMDQLTNAGLDSKNIELSGICTKCNTAFFSHRRGDTGRFAVMAGINHV